jgi:hypothetical protein
MRITIDEQSRLVHVPKGAAMLTLALPHTKTRAELEAAAWGLEAALANASLVVVNVSLSRCARPRQPRKPNSRPLQLPQPQCSSLQCEGTRPLMWPFA